jgi:oligopeptide transport system substrate-binding protein
MKKSLSIALSILLLATVFVSCGGDKKAEETPATTVEKVAVTPKAEVKTPVVVEKEAAPVVVEEKVADEGVVFTISNGAEPASLDPALIQGVPEHRIYMAMFEGLVTNDPITANAVPGLATSWEASEDGTQYTFHLRKTNWSDGTPITANDVVYSWLRELNPDTAAPYAWFPCMFLAGAAEYNSGDAGADAVGIRALDDYTFQMDLIGPIPYAVDALEHYSFAVVPKHAIEEFGDKWTAPENIVANGPFLLKERVPQSYLSFVPNETYWDSDAIKIDKLVILSSE